MEIIELSGQLAEDFQNVQDLTRAASVIVVGTVVEIEYAPYQNIPFTLATVQAEQVLKGDVMPNTRLLVVETGGVFRGQAKDGTGGPGQPIEAAFEGIPVMRKGERWVLFLGPYDPGPVAKRAYAVKGVFQGKLLVGDDGLIRFTGPQSRINEPMFAIPRRFNGRSLTDVLRELQRYLSP